MGLWWSGVMMTVNEQVLDRFIVSNPPPTDIVIIKIDEASLAALGQWPWSRSYHAELLSHLREARVVGFDILFSEAASDREVDIQVAAAMAEHSNVVVAMVRDEQSGILIEPVLPIRTVAKSGVVNTTPDRDGVVRFVSGGQLTDVTFAEVLSGVAGRNLDRDRLWYRGPAATHLSVSYVDVWSGALPPELFANAIVLIGATAPGLGDLYQTPLGAMSGVEIHANEIGMLRDGVQYTHLSSGYVVVVLGLLATLIAVIVWYVRRPLFLGLCLGGGLLLWLVVSAWLFSQFVTLPVWYGIILFIIEGGGLIVISYWLEQQERAFIRRGFAQYVAPEVVAALEANPQLLTLGGEARMLTILFSDIRGFTTLSEQLTPRELMAQLNEYLTSMSDAIMAERGLVDKYIGDAVMAFWNAPLSNERHATDACRSATTMFSALEVLNTHWAEQGRPEFKIGVGISTGEVVVGNMGSHKRFNYSVIGDEVNFTARLEGLTKQYGVGCIISDSTYGMIMSDPQFVVRELDDVVVKGKATARRIYELVTTKLTPEKQAALHQFATGLAAYRAGDFELAEQAFLAGLDADSHDGPCRVFLERCRALRESPPADWDGVYQWTEK